MDSQSLAHDTKDMRIAGCDVHLRFHQAGDGQWFIDATFRCGIADHSRQQSLTSGPCATREEAEQTVLGLVGERLGHNVDRHTSRIHNPTEQNPQ